MSMSGVIFRFVLLIANTYVLHTLIYRSDSVGIVFSNGYAQNLIIFPILLMLSAKRIECNF